MSRQADEEAIVSRLSGAQREKLRQNAYKASWREDSPAALFKLLEDEVLELAEAMMLHADAPDWAERVLYEAADVANFAAMIADVVAAIAAEDAHRNPPT